MKSSKHTEARQLALKFLYQCEMEKVYFFSETRFHNFANYLNIDSEMTGFVESLCKGVLSDFDKIDEDIKAASKNWSLLRIATMDKIILRLAIYEMKHLETPKKVVLNEAIELAKKNESQF